MSMRGSLIAIAVVLLGLADRSSAQQRREGGTEATPLRVELKLPTLFGTTQVGAGTYRIGITDAGLALTIEGNMFTVATIPVQRTRAPAVVFPAQVKVVVRRDIVEIRIAVQNDRLVARGTMLRNKTEDAVGYEKKGEIDLELKAGTRVTDKEALAAAVNRYLPAVTHCGETSRRNHWTTDDPKFVRCLCPIVEKWRLPKVNVALRAHRILVPKQSGMSLSVALDGRTYDCRVWVGATSPELPATDPPPAPFVIMPATAAEALPDLVPIDPDLKPIQP